MVVILMKAIEQYTDVVAIAYVILNSDTPWSYMQVHGAHIL